MSARPNVVSWFEIPVTDFARAKAFYDSVLGVTVETMVMGPFTMGFFSTDPNAVSGAIVLSEGFTPSAQGTIVYLNGGEDLTAILDRVEGAGGVIAVPKTEIGNNFGYFAHFIDTEGNKVGLHSMR